MIEQDITLHPGKQATGIAINSSRASMLSDVAKNQPPLMPLPDISFLKGVQENTLQKYCDTLTMIGGKVLMVDDMEQVMTLMPEHFDATKRIVSTLPALSAIAEINNGEVIDPHTLEDIEVAVIEAHMAVAENGSVWVTEELMGQRVLPFICQHLAVVLSRDNVVASMHEAYRKIGDNKFGFGTFIAGPSKTADIEQSLVLGAHGPRSMTVFLLP